MSKSRLCVVKAFARSFPRYWSQSVVSQGGRTTAHRQTAPSEKHVQVQLSAPAMRREDDLNQPFLGHKDRGSPRPEGRGFPFLVHGPCSQAASQVFTKCPAHLSTGGTQRWNMHLKESHPAHIPFLLLFLAILPQQEKMTRLCHYSN